MKNICQECPRNEPRDGREKGSQFNNAVAPREFWFGQQFWQQAILRRSKKCRLRAGEKDRSHFNVQTLPRKSGSGEQHDSNLKEFCPDSDSALAETIREKAASHRKQDERDGEERTGDQDEPIAISLRQTCAKDEEDDEIFVGVVVECALELGHNQRPESVLP